MFGDNCMEYRCQTDDDTFLSIKQKVAQYFTLREDLVFFADENDCIFMEDMKIVDTLFPLINAQITGYEPQIKVLLQSSMTQIDVMQGNQKEKEQRKLIEDNLRLLENTKRQRKREREEQQRKDDNRRRMINKLMEERARRTTLTNYTSMTIYVVFFVLTFL
jgi:hypothetical protein